MSTHSYASNRSFFQPPTLREGAWIYGGLAVWALVTALFVGLRPEHVYIGLFLALLVFVTGYTRRLTVALLPFIVFAISYDWMNLLPNYEVNPVDIRGLYDAEKGAFGIMFQGTLLTPNEWWALHRTAVLDFLSGFFYLCWVPVPVMFGLGLWFTRQYNVYLRFSLMFLLVNLLGFVLYYVHPAAPPWYVASHGFDFVAGTPGEVAGLGAWDEMTGLGVFHGLYARNANVFAAFPSLHAAYMLVTFIYSLYARCPWWLRTLFGIICAGIWFTAVYTSHHYIIDVLAGITLTLVTWGIFEGLLMRTRTFRTFIDAYTRYIAG